MPFDNSKTPRALIALAVALAATSATAQESEWTPAPVESEAQQSNPQPAPSKSVAASNDEWTPAEVEGPPAPIQSRPQPVAPEAPKAPPAPPRVDNQPQQIVKDHGPVCQWGTAPDGKGCQNPGNGYIPLPPPPARGPTAWTKSVDADRKEGKAAIGKLTEMIEELKKNNIEVQFGQDDSTGRQYMLITKNGTTQRHWADGGEVSSEQFKKMLDDSYPALFAKLQSTFDARYVLKGDVSGGMTSEDAEARFVRKGEAFTKAEADRKFLTVTDARSLFATPSDIADVRRDRPMRGPAGEAGRDAKGLSGGVGVNIALHGSSYLLQAVLKYDEPITENIDIIARLGLGGGYTRHSEAAPPNWNMGATLSIGPKFGQYVEVFGMSRVMGRPSNGYVTWENGFGTALHINESIAITFDVTRELESPGYRKGGWSFANLGVLIEP